jgi:hypothetical protein
MPPMEMALRILAVAAGTALIVATIGSAVKTVILPRAAFSFITRSAFLAVRGTFGWLARPSLPFQRRDRILALYGPLGLMATLALWLTLTFVGFWGIFWGIEDAGWRPPFVLSGTSLFTLGSTTPIGIGVETLAFVEAALGLFLLALLITYLPSVYGSFSRRELGVTALEIRAGSPPSGREMIWRYWVLERMHRLTDIWAEWERWFVDVEETHSSLPALVFFRSPQPDHSWVTAAGAVLDGASLLLSSVDVERDVQAEFCIRSGYLCLRRIATYFKVPYPPDPGPGDPISISRTEWEQAIDSLAAEGVPIKADRDQAWKDFKGWRVNYDRVLLALAAITTAPIAPWSSDRGLVSLRPTLFGGLKKGRN